MHYRKFSSYLRQTYGEKVYKIPISLDGTCPNRDGSVGVGGCTICSEGGVGFELHHFAKPIEEQLRLNKAHISHKYRANKFIIYFQNYTTTYRSIDDIVDLLTQVDGDDVVEIGLSARPDTLPNELLAVLADYPKKIVLELGVQLFNDRILSDINRGHDVAAILDAFDRINQYGLSVCAHLILNLPGATMEDTVTAVETLNRYQIERVKLHSLYIPKGSAIAKDYLAGGLELIGAMDYYDRLEAFIRRAHPAMVIERLFGRAPAEDSLFCNWDRSWRYLQNEFERRLAANQIFQGDDFDETKYS
ncbi:MAG TPA: TIGR01212 family radical SAM protein [Tissierellia bacterium]|nr:TIGR01212 family radical SAM protein [Tissierellia bacterium]